jgi:hypothetical protein
MILARQITALRGIVSLANHVNKISTRCLSRYYEINDNILGLNNEQKEVSITIC